MWVSLLGLKTEPSLCVCQPPSVDASLIQHPNRKFRLKQWRVVWKLTPRLKIHTDRTLRN